MNVVAKAEIMDNGGRRSGVDRRQYIYTSHLPERRSEEDRRCGLDRRSYQNHRGRNGDERRAVYF